MERPPPVANYTWKMQSVTTTLGLPSSITLPVAVSCAACGKSCSANCQSAPLASNGALRQQRKLDSLRYFFSAAHQSTDTNSFKFKITRQRFGRP
jgi:hypothetical protein